MLKKSVLSYSVKLVNLKWTKKVENGQIKMLWPVFRCAQYPKAGQNTQQ